MPTPRISIVTPTLNQGRYIAATIHSVMDQGYPDLEYTIIDGGSTDNTHEVVARLREEYAGAFQFEIVKGLGQVAAINKGLAAATGQILAYINSDDVYLPEVFQIVSHHFREQPQAKWLAAPTILFGGNSHELKIVPLKRPAKDMITWLLGNHVPQPSAFWTREAYTELGPFDERYQYRFDHEYWLRFVEKGFRPIWLECPLSTYRLHPASFTCSRPELFRAELLRIQQQWLPKLTPGKQHRLRTILRGREAAAIQRQALQTASDGHRRQALLQWFANVHHAPHVLLTLQNYRSLRRVLFPKRSH